MATETKATFPHDVLTPLPNERPTVASLRKLKQEITANAISVYSIGGNGRLGHYALVVDNATYLAASNNIAFIAPVHPGANPVHPAAATGPQITEINRRYKAELAEFNTYHMTDAALKKQLIAAIPETYIDILQDQHMGFANVTSLQIMNHLQTTYGKLTIDELTANLARMYDTWSPNDAIEKLFTQIRKCRNFAEADEAITDNAALRAALDNVEKSGVFGDAIKDFRKKEDADKTYDNFVKLFTAADKERRRQLTTKAAGYHSASTVIESKNSETALAATNAKPAGISGVYYCWTHGVGFNKEHSSGTCQSPQPGHRCEATITNMLGGNNYVRRQRGEKQVYNPPPKKAMTGSTATQLKECN
jgi:hypothetical protein